MRRNETTTRTAGRALVPGILLLLALLGGAERLVAQEAIETARGALEKWYETRRIISQEKKDWALGREVLEDRIAVVRREIEAMQGKIADARKSIAEVDAKKAELESEKESLVSAVAAVKDSIEGFETRTRALLKRLPEPLRETVRTFSQRLPEPGSDAAKISMGERFATVVALLNAVNKFNRSININSEVMELAAGRTAEVTTLYLGLGQGYYVTADGRSAGIGSAEKESWVWSAANDFAEKIGRAIAIYKSEKTADFVPLPVRVR